MFPGFWCYFAVVRRERPSALPWNWFWVVLESINGVGHVVWAGMNGGYRPGVGTAVLFLILVPLLVREVRSARPYRQTPAETPNTDVVVEEHASVGEAFESAADEAVVSGAPVVVRFSRH